MTQLFRRRSRQSRGLHRQKFALRRRLRAVPGHGVSRRLHLLRGRLPLPHGQARSPLSLAEREAHSMVRFEAQRRLSGQSTLGPKVTFLEAFRQQPQVN